MGFKSVNELEQFCFDDCQICEIKVSDKEVEFVLEALIVKRNNSQNTNPKSNDSSLKSISLNIDNFYFDKNQKEYQLIQLTN